MRKLFKERKLFKGGNYMRKYGMLKIELSFFRCTRFRFGPLQENQIVPRLEHVATTENVEVTEDGKKALIALSGGDMRKVNNFIDMLL